MGRGVSVVFCREAAAKAHFRAPFVVVTDFMSRLFFFTVFEWGVFCARYLSSPSQGERILTALNMASIFSQQESQRIFLIIKILSPLIRLTLNCVCTILDIFVSLIKDAVWIYPPYTANNEQVFSTQTHRMNCSIVPNLKNRHIS